MLYSSHPDSESGSLGRWMFSFAKPLHGSVLVKSKPSLDICVEGLMLGNS